MSILYMISSIGLFYFGHNQFITGATERQVTSRNLGSEGARNLPQLPTDALRRLGMKLMVTLMRLAGFRPTVTPLRAVMVLEPRLISWPPLNQTLVLCTPTSLRSFFLETLKYGRSTERHRRRCWNYRFRIAEGSTAYRFH